MQILLAVRCSIRKQTAAEITQDNGNSVKQLVNRCELLKENPIVQSARKFSSEHNTDASSNCCKCIAPESNTNNSMIQKIKLNKSNFKSRNSIRVHYFVLN